MLMKMERLLDSFSGPRWVMRRPGSLTVVFDGECLLCRRSVHWLAEQNQSVPIRSIPASSPEAVERFGDIPDYGNDMIVAADDGRTWIGPPDAYLVVMWALPRLRPLSYLLAIRPLKPLVRRVFQLVTGNRRVIGGLLGESCERCATKPRELSILRQS